MTKSLDLLQMLNVPFVSPDFRIQLFRTLGYIYHGCADIGECLATTTNIKDGNYESWYDEWTKLAKRIESTALHSFNNGHFISAKSGYLRSSEYYRQSCFFLRDNLENKKLLEAYNASEACFKKAVHLFEQDVEVVNIPYNNTTLPGYFYNSKESDALKATIIVVGGYDSTLEELYQLGVKAAIDRGYNCLAFVGPGQGAALVKQRLYMKYDFENVITPVVDWLIQHPKVDKTKIAMIGRSFGGYLAPRAVCKEHRIACVVCDPGQIDLSAPISRTMPSNVYEMWQSQDKVSLNQYFAKVFKDNKTLKFFFESRMQVHGLSTVFEYLNEMKNFKLTHIIDNIACPVLICDNPTDTIAARGNDLYQSIKKDKSYFAFEAQLGAGLHCEIGAAAYFEQQVFDWIDSILYRDI